jgi:hypothetical protein
MVLLLAFDAAAAYAGLPAIPAPIAASASARRPSTSSEVLAVMPRSRSSPSAMD